MRAVHSKRATITWEDVMTIGTIRGNRALALAAVGLATFMTSLDNTVVNVALPSIQRDLRLSLGGLEWVASAYVLVFASLLLAGGRLADLYGRRRLFLAGMAVFTAASLLSGLATGEGVLLAGRVLQGAGAALAAPTTLAIISAMFPGERERGRAVGAWSGVTALAVALGPLAGGFISQHWHWGWIFYINVPLGLLTLAAGAAAISESRDRSVARSLDLPGLVTSTIALSALTYALIQGHAAGWTSPVILAALALAAVAGGAFAAAESRARAPMVDLALFRSRVFSGGTATLVLWGFGVLGVYFFTPLYLQGILGFSPTRAGLAFVPMALLMAVSATVAPLVSGKAGTGRTVAAGMGLVAAGLAATALLGVTVIGAILTARQASALAGGATPHAAFLHGYSAGLAAAAALVAVGGAIAVRTLRGHSDAATAQPQPGAARRRAPQPSAAA